MISGPPFFDFDSAIDFDSVADATWRWQIEHNSILRSFVTKSEIEGPYFFPIQFFRDTELVVGSGWDPELVFRSSGTTGSVRSAHFVRHASIYRKSLLNGFRHFYDQESFVVLALLPHYLEAGDSSLVYMVKAMMDTFGLPGSGFFLGANEDLVAAVENARDSGRRILLFGAAYALLDLAQEGLIKLPSGTVVVETGGMKGRGEELVRMELHELLRSGLGVDGIHSEYGMTELLSQAWAVNGVDFVCPPWMKVVITDPNTVRRELAVGETGRINVIDLANIHSCSFVRTDDLGRMNSDGSFQVLGRMDGSELRGCNLLVV